MATAMLFPSLLGAEFPALDPCLRWIHSGESRRLSGRVTVERGRSFIAAALGFLAALPTAMVDAPIEVSIECTPEGETWTRLFGGSQAMSTTLHSDGELLVEKLGPGVLKFRLSARGGGITWKLEHITAFGIALPVRWFCVSAAIGSRNGRYHFIVDSALRGVGRIVRYEGVLDAAT
jgi:hypothetical protein